MPKRIFRLRISNIGLKQKLFSQSFKSKLNGKPSAKFVWIDGSVKKDWRSLKVKSGYRTDRLFLYYLLRLAKRDLLGIRNNDDSKGTRDECHSKKEKLPSSYENSSNQSWSKCLTERLEKEKKIKEKETDVGVNAEKKILVDDEENFNHCGRNTDRHPRFKSGIECNSGDSGTDNILNNLTSPSKNAMKGKNKMEFHSEEREKGSKASDEKIKYSERKHKMNKQSSLWKNKQLKVRKNKSKTKNEFCIGCKLKHTGKCKTKIKTTREISKSNSLSQLPADDNVYRFEDSEQETAQQGMSPEKKSNFDALGKCRMPESLSFAKTTLPENLFLKTVNPDHGLSVFTKVPVKKSTQFGPLIGQRVKEMEIGDNVNLRDIWQVHLAEGITYLSTQDEETSNWLRYIRPADNKETANLFTLVRNNSLYFDVVKDINKGEELLYWINDSHLHWSKKKLEKKNCGGCNIQFAHTLYYQKHCMIFHDPNISLTTRKYHCKICGLAVLGKEKIIKHAAEMHHGKGAYQCQYCHKFFLRLNYLEMHRTYGCSENPQRSRPLCDLCGRKFCQPQKLKAHIKRMHSDMAVVLRDFQCKNCQKILGSRAALQRHLKEVHNKSVVGAFTCDRCGKIFQNKSNLKIHMLTHSGVKPFKCQEMDCSAAFTTKQCLKFHYKKIHGFSDEVIPKIERSVAYTFDAYSGGAVSDPDQDSSLQLDNSQYLTTEEKKEGVDLTLSVATAAQDFSNGKRSTFSPLLPEDPNLIIHLDEKYACTKSSKENARRGSGSYHVPKTRIIPDDDDVAYPQSEDLKANKTCDKKLWGVPDKIDLTQPVFKENSTTSLLVEAAIDAAEKDLIEKSSQETCKPVSCDGDEEIMENHSEVYSFNHYDHNPPSEVMCEPNLKKPQLYEKPGLEGPKINGFQEAEYRGNFLLKDKSNFNDIFKFNTFLRINTSPFSEIQKDCNLVISVRDQDEEEEMENSRGKDLVTSDGFRSQDAMRPEKFNSCRNIEYDLRLSSGVKFDYGDVDFSEYRSLERSRSLDLGLQRLADKGCEGYERIMEAEKEGGAENLCLKEKPYQCDNLEEFSKLGREGSGFENVFPNETTVTGQSQSFGTLFRSPHGIVSPRSYHPGAFESESVDLSVRPPFSSSPIYTLDLTPSRVELPSRHLDFRSHLGLPPLRFGSSASAISNGDSPQISSTGYGIYQSSYGVSAHRPCQSSQFQPYTPLYY